MPLPFSYSYRKIFSPASCAEKKRKKVSKKNVFDKRSTTAHFSFVHSPSRHNSVLKEYFSHQRFGIKEMRFG